MFVHVINIDPASKGTDTIRGRKTNRLWNISLDSSDYLVLDSMQALFAHPKKRSCQDTKECCSS